MEVKRIARVTFDWIYPPEGLQNSSQQDSEFYTEQQNLNNSQGQLLA